MEKSYHTTANKQSNSSSFDGFMPSLDDFDFKDSNKAKDNSAAESNLTDKDKKMLLASGIPLKLQTAYGIRRVTDEEGAEIIGQQRKAGREFAGLVFPIFTTANQTLPSEYELRRDVPDEEIKNGVKKESGKYLRPPGRGNLLALPRNISDDILNDVSVPILVCEGIKKLLSAWHLATWNLAEDTKPRFIPVSLSGVWGFRGKVGKTEAGDQRRDVKGLLSGFHNLSLKHRSVIICFDNDVHTNFKVKLARHQLAETLQAETGAVCYFINLPKSNEKIGLDDFLGSLNGDLTKGLKLLETKYRFSNELQSNLCDHKILLAASGADRGKCKITVKDADGETIAIDTFNLAEADKRNKFVKQIESVLSLSADEKTEIQRELLGLAEISDELTGLMTPEIKSDEIIQTSFQILKDGRVIEQIRDGFAVYNPETKEHSILDSVADADGITYEPIEDELFQKAGGIQLANELTEYETEAELIVEIERYLSSYLDLKPLYLKLTALYILFTYIFDAVLELSYLNATGDPGSGKSRFGSTVSLASHRGLALITPSAASLYRIVDKFKPTLFIDEFNSDVNSDDAAAIIQILNAGFQQTAQIPRQVATGDGQFKTEMFDAFCPKIIGSLKQSASNAFNSRCIEIQMERTTRNDIPLRLSRKLLADAQNLRNRLTLWRLRNIQTDFEAKLDRAEAELRQHGIMPRSIQINIPLFALINDELLKKDFINLLKGRDVVLNEEKRNSIDGELVQTLHNILFDVQEDGSAKWSINRPQENELCEDLRIEKVVAMMNFERKDKDHLNARYIGKKIIGLGLRSAEILSRQSEYRRKSAIYFDSHRLKIIFTNYGLPIPADFSSDQSDQHENLNNVNHLSWSDKKNNDSNNQSPSDQFKSNNANNSGKWSDWSDEISEKDGQDQINDYSDQSKGEIFEI